MNESTNTHRPWPILLIAAALLMITMGGRQATGLLVLPVHEGTGVGLAAISLALAVGQFSWGLAQPAFGAIADQFGALRVLMLGGLLLAAGYALAPLLPSEWGLLLTLGILAPIGSAAASFSILIGAASRAISEQHRSFAAGFINAGGSLGQFLFAPLVQAVLVFTGWRGALLALAGLSLLTLPLALLLPRGPQIVAHAAAAPPLGMGAQLREAARNPSYWFLHLGFFTCGFHIAFLATHLPGEVELCGLDASVSAAALSLIGLFNVVGSLSAGALGQRMPMKWLLAGMYASRALMIAIYLDSPPTPTVFYAFAAALGLTWLATVPPTVGLVGKLFGPRYLGTLFGLTLFSHQIGGFLGAWLGGLAIEHLGAYTWMWYADMALALLAALSCLPIAEARHSRARLQPAD